MFSEHALDLDAAAEARRLCTALSDTIGRRLRRRGAVLGVSGGVDSAVVLALCVRALGPDLVLALIMPERESEPASAVLARNLAMSLGVTATTEDITPALEALRCYELRDAAIRGILPEYDTRLGYRAKITLPSLAERDKLNAFSLKVVRPDGSVFSTPLEGRQMREIMSASNLKQRTRMMVLYRHAELHNYAVVGTANRDEHDLGFFVKNGDGAIDVNPIVHLYKTQVYQLAAYLEIPEAIRQRTPTSDTYGASASQEEFFFRLPFKQLDLIQYGLENNVPIEEVWLATGLPVENIQATARDVNNKRRTTEYLRTPPVTFGPPQMSMPAAQSGAVSTTG